MKVSIREFRNNIAKYLKELPVEITRHNEVVAVVSFPSKIVFEGKIGGDPHNPFPLKKSKPVRQKPEPFKMPDTWTKKYKNK